MAPDHRPIDELIRAVLDGESIEWPDDSNGRTGRLAAHLRVVAAIANAHHEEASTPDGASPVNPGLAPLETWGHLRIAEQIGFGAFGRVYRAWDARLERDVALKLLPVGSDDRETAAEMLREGRLLARVRHSNVVTIHGADHIDGYVGLWMELIEGRTLEDLIQSGETPEPGEVARIGIELARALGAVHAAGLLHRDVKAQNVMGTGEGRVVLMDFGAGRELISAALDMTGTPLYLAPEVLSGQPATARSDIYSLGVLLHRLLTGSFPVRGETIREVRLAHERNAQETPPSVRPEVLTPLARVIKRAIDPRPDKRHGTAVDLCSALEAAAVSTSQRGWRRSAVLALLLTSLAWLALSLWWWPHNDDRSITSGTPAPTSRPTASTPPAADGPPTGGSSGRAAQAPERQTGDIRTSKPSTEEDDSRTPEVVAGARFGTVEGTVTDDTGKGVPGATVIVSDIRSYVIPDFWSPFYRPELRTRDGSISSGADGSYELQAVPAGDYVVMFRLQPAGCQGVSCLAGFRAAGPFTVAVLPGGTVRVPPVRLCGAQTDPSCRAVDAPYQHVLVPGFLTDGFQHIDANAETTGMLKKILGSLAHNEPTNLSWSEATTRSDLATLFGESRANDEKDLALGEDVFTNAEYWRQIGGRFRHPFMATDTRPLIVTGAVVLAQHDRTDRGRSGKSLDFLTKIVFIDGRTGELVHTIWSKKLDVDESTRTSTAWYFQQMYSLMREVFGSIMRFIGRAY